MKKAYGIRESMEMTGVSRSTLRRAIEAGDLRTFQESEGAPHHIPAAELAAWHRLRTGVDLFGPAEPATVAGREWLEAVQVNERLPDAVRECAPAFAEWVDHDRGLLDWTESDHGPAWLAEVAGESKKTVAELADAFAVLAAVGYFTRNRAGELLAAVPRWAPMSELPTLRLLGRIPLSWSVVDDGVFVAKVDRFETLLASLHRQDSDDGSTWRGEVVLNNQWAYHTGSHAEPEPAIEELRRLVVAKMEEVARELASFKDELTGD